jgi:hypothetical protein
MNLLQKTINRIKEPDRNFMKLLKSDFGNRPVRREVLVCSKKSAPGWPEFLALWMFD